MEMSYHSDPAADTCEHLRELFPAPYLLQRILPGAMVRVDIHDEGHRALEVGVFLDRVCVGDLRGRFSETAAQLGCTAGEMLGECVSRFWPLWFGWWFGDGNIGEY